MSSKQVNGINTNNYLNVLLHEKIYKFPFIWLRDNCQCPKCFHPKSNSRIILWKHFNVNTKVKSVDDEENSVKIEWEDGHSSDYEKEWLYQRNFSEENREKFLSKVYKPKKVLWNKYSFESIKKNFDYKSIVEDDRVLCDWLMAMSIYGVTIVDNVPLDEGSARKVADRVEFHKKTHYGEQFVVKDKPGTTNVAYLAGGLQMHTDLPYYEFAAGIIMLHCLVQAPGNDGGSQLCDGLYIGEILKREYPDSYKILKEVMVDWEDIGMEGTNKFHSYYRSPVICEDPEGTITRVNYSVPQRSSHFMVPLEKVTEWYDAFKLFTDLLYEHAADFRINAGQMLCFDNIRFVHARKEYVDTSESKRELIGVYVDWDYIYSRLRVLLLNNNNNV